MIKLSIDDPRWIDFVADCSQAAAFHHPAWARVLSDCYGYGPFALALTDTAGAIQAGIPVLEVRRFLRRSWVSLPFTDHCPPLARTEEARGLLARSLAGAHKEAEVPRLEVRAELPPPATRGPRDAVIHKLELSRDPEAVFKTFSRSQVQQRIRKAEREQVLSVRKAHSAEELTDTFYRLHLATRRRIGAPVQPRRFFKLLWDRILEPELGFLLLAYADQRPVAGAVFLSWNGTVIYKYGASSPSFWRLRPNNLILWTAIREGCENGDRLFDFGRSDADNAGLRAFKSGFGAREEPLVYTVFGDGSSTAAAGGLQKPLSAVIRRSPEFVCRALGEAFYKYAA